MPAAGCQQRDMGRAQTSLCTEANPTDTLGPASSAFPRVTQALPAPNHKPT